MTNTNWQKEIGNSERGFFHHAFILEGDRGEIKNSLIDFLKVEFGIIAEGNPDFSEQTHRKFGVEESHALKEAQSRRAFTEGGRKIFIVCAETFPGEVQNSLLKIFEEPTEGTVFFIIAPSVQFFLPTILSRVVCVQSEKNVVGKDVVEFLNKTYNERLAVAATFSAKNKGKDTDEDDSVEDVEKEKEKEKDETSKRARALALLDGIIGFYYEKGLKGKRTLAENHALELAIRYREYAHGHSPSLKMIFEHLALAIPLELRSPR